MIEVERAVPESLGDVGDAVLSQDVEGETTGSSHDPWVVADAATILVAGNVADIMVAVLDAPMAADGRPPSGGREAGGGGEVVGDLAAFVPQAGGGGSEQGVAGDPDNGLDEGMPLGCGQGFADGKDFDGAILLAGTAGVACECGLGGAGVVGNDADGFKQFGLVGLQLDEEMVARFAGDLEGFFDSAWHQG